MRDRSTWCSGGSCTPPEEDKMEDHARHALGADEDLAFLRHEFDAEDGSFLLQLRIDHVWDQAAFTRLTEAMRRCCVRQAEAGTLDRWLTGGFWYLADYIPAHTRHPNFPRVYDPAYYEAAFERLWALATWYLTGLNPYMPGTGYDPL